MSKFSEYVELGSLYKRCPGVLPSGVLALDEISNTCINYTTGGFTAKEYRWDGWASNTNNAQTGLLRLDSAGAGGAGGSYDASNPFPFNIQGQKWIRDIRPTFTGPQTYGGVKNCATPRRYTASGLGLTNEPFPHIIVLEFLYTGIGFSVVHMNLGGDNSTTEKVAGTTDVYIECGGEMHMAASAPKQTTRTSGEFSFRNIQFNEYQFETKVRVVCAAAGFCGIRTDARSILSPAPNLITVGFDADSYGESSQALTADPAGHQYLTHTIANFLYRETGFSIPMFGQGATGFFSNGAGQVFDDTVGSATQFVALFSVTVTGLSRFFSGSGAGVSSRRGWMTDANTAIQALGKPAFTQYSGEFFGGPLGLRPAALIQLGTWNDESSGVVTDSQMYSRVADCYDWVHTTDPYCKLIHVSPEPFDDGLFATNTGIGQIGPPRDGGLGDVYVKAQKRAAAERDWVQYVNAYGPADPWWTGKGPALLTAGGAYNVPSNSQQAQLVSPEDSIHGKLEMARYLSAKFKDSIASTPVLVKRVNGEI